MSKEPEFGWPETAPQPAPDPTDRIVFHYIKSNFFRVVFADGFLAGPTPNGLIHLDFYNQRAAIPKQVTHIIKPDGHLGPEEDRVSRGGIVREVEGAILMSAEVAKELVRVLQEKITMIDEARKAADARDRISSIDEGSSKAAPTGRSD